MVNWSTTAFVFPGQGSQVVGMGKDIADAYSISLETFKQANDALGYELSKLCFEGPEELLNDTLNTQPALYVCSMAILRALQQELPNAKPAFMAGHSLGEFSALTAAGSLSFEDGLRLVAERARLMKQAGESNPGAMAALLGMETDTIREICARASQEIGKSVVIANDNCPGQIVISGDNQALDRALELAKEAGGKRVMKLAVSVAAHSPLMKSAADQFKHTLANTNFETPQVPLYANVTAKPLSNVDEMRHELEVQLVQTVRWTDTIQNMIANGADTFIEIGSKDVLTGLLRRINKEKSGSAMNTLANLRDFVQNAT